MLLQFEAKTTTLRPRSKGAKAVAYSSVDSLLNSSTTKAEDRGYEAETEASLASRL